MLHQQAANELMNANPHVSAREGDSKAETIGKINDASIDRTRKLSKINWRLLTEYKQDLSKELLHTYKKA